MLNLFSTFVFVIVFVFVFVSVVIVIADVILFTMVHNMWGVT